MLEIFNNLFISIAEHGIALQNTAHSVNIKSGSLLLRPVRGGGNLSANAPHMPGTSVDGRVDQDRDPANAGTRRPATSTC